MNKNRNLSQRKPFIALALALLMPGLGQLYIGQASKGITIFLLISFLTPIFGWLAINLPGSLLIPSVLVGVLLSILLYIYAAVDAFKKAKHIGPDYALRSYNSIYTYISLFLFGYFFIQSYLVDYSKSHFTSSYIVPTHSMIPSIFPGETIFAKGNFNCPGCKGLVKRGDIATFVYPNDRTNVYIKRVIALPGDSVRIDGFKVYVNDKLISGEITEYQEYESLLKEQYVTVWEKGDVGSYQVIWAKSYEAPTIEVKVPNGYVFVLGDHRSNSSDSRHFGPVPLMDVTGKAARVWLSKDDSSTLGIAWSRIGSNLDLDESK